MLNLKNEASYRDALASAGFRDISSDTESRGGWIRVVARS